MAHLRRQNGKSGRNEDHPGSYQSSPSPQPLRQHLRRCTTCSLVCFGLVMALLGAVAGMYFKSALQDVYLSTAGHLSDLSSLDSMKKQLPNSSLLQDRASLDLKAVAAAEAAALSASWNATYVGKAVCDDSCPASKNKQCNDGRSGNGQVLCDLGTDCTDCGSWTFQVFEGNDTIARPIAFLQQQNVTVNTAWTHTVPSFLMPFTDHAQDVDVSAQMHETKVVEIGITQAWYKVLQGQCMQADGHRQLVLDIGANFGYYTFYAVAHGCRVVAWEPVPLFRAFLEYGLQLNNDTSSVRVRDRVVGEKAGQEYKLTVPSQGIWGTASIDGRNIDEGQVGAHRQVVKAQSERVDTLVHEDVLVLKLDVEGFEPSAFQSMKGLFDSQEVSNMFMEYSPGVYEANQMWDDYPDVPRMLSYLLEHGFTILHINDQQARGLSLLKLPNWTGRLPEFEEVTSENLKYDLEDARKLQSRILGCWPPKELTELNPGAWSSCNSIPEDLHPKGFRSTFGHNTNIWASAARESLEIGQPVGIQAVEQEDEDWYGRSRSIGMGGRTCRNVHPISVLVRHRCPCTHASCKPEARLVEKLNHKGLMGKLSNREEEAQPPPEENSDPRFERGDEEH